MKRIKLRIQEYSINKIVGRELELSLHEKANAIDAITELDRLISSKGEFPSEDYKSLIHWLYNPLEERFCKHVSITAYAGPLGFLNIRENPEMELPDGATVILVPEGPCITERERVLDYERFLEAISER